MSREVELASIRSCLQPGVPAPVATCAPDGTPHVSYIHQVQYLDAERVGTSRQVFSRALESLPAGAPRAGTDRVYRHRRAVTARPAVPAHRYSRGGVRGDAGHGRCDWLADARQAHVPAARPRCPPRAAMHAASASSWRKCACPHGHHGAYGEKAEQLSLGNRTPPSRRDRSAPAAWPAPPSSRDRSTARDDSLGGCLRLQVVVAEIHAQGGSKYPSGARRPLLNAERRFGFLCWN